MLVSKNEIAFKPLLTSIKDLNLYNGASFSSIEQIVIMSATLGGEDIIKESLGWEDEIGLINNKIVTTQEETMGERIIFPITNTNTAQTISDTTLDVIEKIQEDFGKCLLFSNWKGDTKLYKGLCNQKQIPYIEYFEDEHVNEFRSINEGFLISTGRYIGLDLPGLSCQVGVQPRIPFVLGPIDALRKNILKDEEFVNEKVAHRLIQAFGRCNRGHDDLAIYFVLDDRFPAMMRQPSFFDRFSPELKAQATIGRREVGREAGFEDIINFGKEFLSGNYLDYQDKLEKYKDKDVTKAKIERPELVSRISAWRFLYAQDYLRASEKFERLSDKLKRTDTFLAGWSLYMAAMSKYLAIKRHGIEIDIEEVVKMLEQSKSNCSNKSKWFDKLSGVASQIKNDEVKEDEIADVSTMDLREKIYRNWRDFRDSNTKEYEGIINCDPRNEFERIIAEFERGTHNKITHELEQLFLIMGYEEVVREKRDVDKVDLLLFSTLEKPHHQITIEFKSFEEDGQVTYSDIEQVNGYANAQEIEHTSYEKVHPVLLTNGEKVHTDAEKFAKKTKVRIIKGDIFIKFLKCYIDAMEDFWKFEDVGQRDMYLNTIMTPKDLLSIFEFEDVYPTDDQINNIFD